MRALDDFSGLERGARHAAHARRRELVVARLHALQAAEPLVALLLPLGDERRVRVALAQAVLVELARNARREGG